MSCDSFTTAYSCMLLLFFLQYASEFCHIAALAVLPLVCLLPLVVTPVMYAFIHRKPTLLFGRYHLVMPLSAFLAAVMFAVMWGAVAPNAAGSCAVVLGALFFAVALPLYRYCAFSVRVRMGDGGFSNNSLVSGALSLFGGAACVLSYYGFSFYDPATAFSNTAFVLAAVGVILALFQYLTTFYGIPKLGGRRTVTVRGTFHTLFSGLNKRVFFGVLLFDAAFVAATAHIVYFSAVLCGGNAPIAAAGAFVVGFGLGSAIFDKFAVHTHARLYNVIFPCLAAASVAVVVAVSVGVSATVAFVISVVGAAGIGVAGGAAIRQNKLKLVSVKPNITSGIVFILSELMLSVSGGIAVLLGVVAVAVVRYTGTAYAFIAVFGAVFALAVAALCVTARKSVRSYRPPTVTYEMYPDDEDGVRPHGLASASDEESTAFEDGEK